MLTVRQVLVALSLHYEGNYKLMFDEIAKKKHSLSTAEMEKLSKTAMKSMVCDCTSEDYPVCFKGSTYPSMIFYYYGNLSLLNEKYRITCVGTRKPNLYQNETCYRFLRQAEEKFQNRLVVVSGMAQGLDQTFMKAAMEMNAPVVSIIGSGIDNPYPEDNDGIYDYCKSGKGLVLSEYPLDIKAQADHFLFRNRLLAAASPILFVGGGKRKSGTFASVNYALEGGKSVAALPCNVTGDDLTNLIIKEGATPILDADDLVKEIKEACENNLS